MTILDVNGSMGVHIVLDENKWRGLPTHIGYISQRGFEVGKGVGLTHKKYRLGHGSTRFCFGSKKSSSDQVFFGSGQKILTHFAMSKYSVERTFISEVFCSKSRGINPYLIISKCNCFYFHFHQTQIKRNNRNTTSLKNKK